MSPLIAVMLLLYGLLIALSLTIWAALTLRRAPPQPRVKVEAPPPPPKQINPPEEITAPQSGLSNDDIRGAKAPPRRRGIERDDDPFERFIRAGKDDRRF